MNINGNGQTRNYQHQQGGFNVNGNNNTIELINCLLAITIAGSGNIFRVKGCSLQIQLNGNGNFFDCMNSSIQIGINGNGNELIQKDTSVKINNINGHANNIDKGDHNNSNFLAMQQQFQNNQIKNSMQKSMNPFDLLSAVQQSGSMSSRNPYEPINFYNQSQNNQIKSSQTNNLSRPVNRPNQSVRNNMNNGQKINNGNISSTNNINRYNSWGSRQNEPMRMNDRNMYKPNTQNNEQINPYRPNINSNSRENPSMRSTRNYQPPTQPNNSTLFESSTMFSSKCTTGFSSDQLKMFHVSVYEGTTNQCNICLQNIKKGDKVIYLVCFHYFHEKCIMDWLRKSSKCPMCQINIRELLGKSKYMKLMN